MTVRENLLDLQWVQLKHDEGYHKDILALPVARRIQHMALHNAKYTAYFIDAIERQDDDRLKGTLVDAFIIALASANALNQNLGKDLAEQNGMSLVDLGLRFAGELNRDESDPLWLVRHFARHMGQLAKIAESWDHLEPVAFRETMKACNAELLKLVLAETASRGVDLAAAFPDRLRAVEAYSIFDARLRTEREVPA